MQPAALRSLPYITRHASPVVAARATQQHTGHVSPGWDQQLPGSTGIELSDVTADMTAPGQRNVHAAARAAAEYAGAALRSDKSNKTLRFPAPRQQLLPRLHRLQKDQSAGRWPRAEERHRDGACARCGHRRYGPCCLPASAGAWRRSCGSGGNGAARYVVRCPRRGKARPASEAPT